MTLACGVGIAAATPPAHADLGSDLERLRLALGSRVRAEALAPRLYERGDVLPIALSPWALEEQGGRCTTLVFIAPAPTQFGLHLRPWQGLPSGYFSRAGAIELTRCGVERASLLGLLLEMRSPRAVVHTLIAVGDEPRAPFLSVLPERETGPAAPEGSPGPAPRRQPLVDRVQRFQRLAREAGPVELDQRLLPQGGFVRLSLEPGCHRLFVPADAPTDPAHLTLVLRESETGEPERYPASASGDVAGELCTARSHSVLASLEGADASGDRQLLRAHFALPVGLPGRFGPQAAEQLARALGGSTAPRRLGPLVLASLGAQGQTPLPRKLLPHTCYLAAVAALHGQAVSLSLVARAATTTSEDSSVDDNPGARVGFCTGRDGHVALSVEARGVGVAWLLTVFQSVPAQVAP